MIIYTLIARLSGSSGVDAVVALDENVAAGYDGDFKPIALRLLETSHEDVDRATKAGEDDHRAAVELGPTTFSFIAWNEERGKNQTDGDSAYFAVLCLCDEGTGTEDAFRSVCVKDCLLGSCFLLAMKDTCA